jgi:hypothetical protein
MENQIIEQFIDNEFNENQITALYEETSLVTHFKVKDINETIVNEIKKYSDRGFRINKYGMDIVVYHVDYCNEIWVEGGY